MHIIASLPVPTLYDPRMSAVGHDHMIGQEPKEGAFNGVTNRSRYRMCYNFDVMGHTDMHMKPSLPRVKKGAKGKRTLNKNQDIY